MKSLIVPLLLASLSWAHAQEVKTGEGIRQKAVAFLTFDVYRISHYTSAVPAGDDLKEGLINSTGDKRFELEFMRDVEADKIKDSLTEAYGACGFLDRDKVGRLLAVFKSDFKKGDKVGIAYSAGKTTFTAEGSSLSMDGDEIMRATWCIWLGKGIKDQPKLKDELVKRAKK